MCNEIEGSYDKIIITIAPSYTGENITRLLPLALLLVLHTRNNTDGNKVVIFSGIAWYYGDNYIVFKNEAVTLNQTYKQPAQVFHACRCLFSSFRATASPESRPSHKELLSAVYD